MKLSSTLILVLIIVCIIGPAYAAPATKWGSDGEPQNATIVQPTKIVSSPAKTNVKSANTLANTGSDAVLFTATSSSGVCMDNTKKVAVYMPNMTRQMHFEYTLLYGDVAVNFDPLTAAMLYEYNPDYIGDSNLASLTPANYGILIVPTQEMSNNAATAINTYISSGGSVWFLNDPCYTETGTLSANRITVLGTGTSATISGSSTISVVNIDSITSGLPASFRPEGTASKTIELRARSGSGTVSGMNYQVLMSSGTNNAMLIKFENPTTGARVIYSNPNMFISGGTSSYFKAQNATRLFLQTKAWVMKLAQNPSGVEITYPNTDKQFIVTVDDCEGGAWEIDPTQTLFNAETAAGVTPKDVNTFFMISTNETTRVGMQSYEQNGDTHGQHPHVNATYQKIYWDINTTSIQTYEANLSESKARLNQLMGTSDYGFTSFRFPYTSYCENAMQAVSNSGYKIDSSNGVGAMSLKIGNHQDNTALLPKQVLIRNAKTNLIEMEYPATFDIEYYDTINGVDVPNGNYFYDNNTAVLPQLKNGNFPMNFVLGGHYEGIGIKPVLATNLTKILTASKDTNPSFTNLNTLANYITATKSATITASTSGNITTVNVVNAKLITDFTVKVALGNVVSATCDGAAIPSNKIKQDRHTSSWYVTQTIDAGTHTFIIYHQDPKQPVANFAYSPTSGIAPLTVQFTDSSVNADTISWDFENDGVADNTTRNAVHVYAIPGTYTVNLTAANEYGTNSKTAQISVGNDTGTLAALFSASPTAGPAPLSVAFTDLSTGGPIAWKWVFGDSTNSTERYPVHIYSKAGLYTVSLTASKTGNSKTLTKSNYIAVSNSVFAPVTDFSATPSSGAAPLSVNFTDLSKGSPTSWKWSFGDGVNSTDKNPVHVYNKSGLYTVSLTATNAAGSKTLTKSNYIGVSNSVYAPVAAFSATPTSGAAPLSVNFADTSTGSPTAWKWTFGDGTTSTEQNPVHTYSNAGLYAVSLNASNAAGNNTVTKSNYIVVSSGTAAPVALFSATPTSGSRPLSVNFTDLSTGSPATWKWTFGDGTTSTLQNPVKIYNVRGQFTVSLTVNNAGGNSVKTLSKYITVN